MLLVAGVRAAVQHDAQRPAAFSANVIPGMASFEQDRVQLVPIIIISFVLLLICHIFTVCGF
jgi:hypothetical protein